MQPSVAAGPREEMPDNPGKALRNWSSLIGIVTAIVGNVLIALALNVQRYAHTSLHKERVRVRRRARAAVKRAQGGGGGGGRAGCYGAMDGDANGGGGGGGGATITNGRTNGRGGGGDDDDETLLPDANAHANTDLEAGRNEDGGDDDDDYDDELGKVTSSYLKSTYWWLGQILITLGEMGNFLAYGFAPASIVSPLGVVALVSNCIIAPVMFHETFRARDFWGVVIAVAGVVTVVLSARQEETKLGPHEVWEAITTPAFEIYLAVTMLLILVLVWASGRYGKRTILIDLGLVGLFGGYTALATKGVSSMLSSTLWRAFTTPVTYALVLVLLVTAVMQIRYVNKALQRFDSTQVIPIQFVLFTLCVILGSAILYRDFEKTTGEQAAKFVGGCLLTFFGVFLITSGREQQEDDEDEDGLSDAEGVEETIGLMQQEGNNHAPAAAARPQDVPARRSQSPKANRLSRVSFADTARPAVSCSLDEAAMPAMMHTHVHGGGELLLGDDDDDESTPLVSNPWRESWDGGGAVPPQPPRGTRTLSADAALTATTSSSHSLAATPTRGSPLSHPHALLDRPVTPRGQGGGASRTWSHHGRSKPFISPSPLSSTVTTVVKDAFLGRYGRSLGKRTSLKRLRSSIRASLFFMDDDDRDGGGGGAGRGGVAAVAAAAATTAAATATATTGTAAAATDDDDPPRTSRGPAAAADPRRRRSRSLSDALGELFRPRKKKPWAAAAAAAESQQLQQQGEGASDVGGGGGGGGGGGSSGARARTRQ